MSRKQFVVANVSRSPIIGLSLQCLSVPVAQLIERQEEAEERLICKKPYPTITES